MTDAEANAKLTPAKRTEFAIAQATEQVKRGTDWQRICQDLSDLGLLNATDDDARYCEAQSIVSMAEDIASHDI